jgi:putative Holliday junction resolvase
VIRPGRRLGVDAGQARIGIATCDPEGILATPVMTLARSGQSDEAMADQIAALAATHDVIEIVVGLPIHLSGDRGAAVDLAEALARAIARAQSRPVRLIDERLTTVQAAAELHRAGRAAKRHRAVIDQVAAVLILQSALDAERSAGRPPGQILSLDSGGEKGAEE